MANTAPMIVSTVKMMICAMRFFQLTGCFDWSSLISAAFIQFTSSLIVGFVQYLHVQQRGAEGDEDLAVLRDDVVPLPVVLTHHELEVELQGFYVGALRYILLDS